MGMAYGTKPIDQEWPLSPLVFILAEVEVLKRKISRKKRKKTRFRPRKKVRFKKKRKRTRFPPRKKNQDSSKK